MKGNEFVDISPCMLKSLQFHRNCRRTGVASLFGITVFLKSLLWYSTQEQKLRRTICHHVSCFCQSLCSCLYQCSLLFLRSLTLFCRSFSLGNASLFISPTFLSSPSLLLSLLPSSSSSFPATVLPYFPSNSISF